MNSKNKVHSLGSFNFSEDIWTEMLEIKDSQFDNLRIVGWFHSHPGHGIFFSSKDIFIQQGYFNLPWQIAMIYDPYQNTGGFFISENKSVIQAPGFIELFDKNKSNSIINWTNLNPKKENSQKRKSFSKSTCRGNNS